MIMSNLKNIPDMYKTKQPKQSYTNEEWEAISDKTGVNPTPKPTETKCKCPCHWRDWGHKPEDCSCITKPTETWRQKLQSLFIGMRLTKKDKLEIDGLIQSTLDQEKRKLENKYKAKADKYDEMVMNAAKFSHELEYPKETNEKWIEKIIEDYCEVINGTTIREIIDNAYVKGYQNGGGKLGEKMGKEWCLREDEKKQIRLEQLEMIEGKIEEMLDYEKKYRLGSYQGGFSSSESGECCDKCRMEDKHFDGRADALKAVVGCRNPFQIESTCQCHIPFRKVAVATKIKTLEEAIRIIQEAVKDK